jgi:hypothetical protein
MKKPVEKTDGKYRTITIRTDVLDELEKLRFEKQMQLGFTELSWTNYMAIVVQRLKAGKK